MSTDNHFLETHAAYLTPLSPIHLGCGQDYEPTNFFIEDSMLYNFAPEILGQDSKLRGELLRLLSGNISERTLIDIQNTLRRNSATIKAAAINIRSVSQGVMQHYLKAYGKLTNQQSGDDRTANQFRIEQIISNPHSHQPYIPGSALKGCIRTAILDSQPQSNKQPTRDETDNNGQLKGKAKASYEQRLLGGSFATDPLRLLKISDLTPTNPEQPINAAIAYAVNRKKKISYSKDGKANHGNDNLATFKEHIEHGQYRAFMGSIALQHIDPTIANRAKPQDTPKNRPDSLKKWIIATNRYHQTILQNDLNTLEKHNRNDLIDQDWLNSFRALLANIQSELDAGNILLVRLGKHGGAENKTLNGGIARIKINLGKDRNGKKNTPLYLDHSTTYWLKANHKDERENLLPYGWAIIELDDNPHPAIADWCSTYQAHHQAILDKLQQTLAQHQAIKEKLAAQQTEAAEKAAAQAAYNEKSELEKTIINLQEKLTRLKLPLTQQDRAFDAIFTELSQILEAEKTAAEKATLQQHLPNTYLETLFQFAKSPAGKKRKAKLAELLAQQTA